MKIRGFIEMTPEKGAPVRYEAVIQVPAEFTDREIELNLTRALSEACTSLDRNKMRVVGWTECEYNVPVGVKPAAKERAA